MSKIMRDSPESYPLININKGNKNKCSSVSSVNNPRLFDDDPGSTNFDRQVSDIDYKSVNYIHKFAREGDAEKLSVLIKHLPNAKKYVNNLNDEKMAPLHYAARYNHLECVKILVEKALANVNVLNDEKVTPLHFAARYRRKYQTKQLIEEVKVQKLKKSNSEPNINKMDPKIIENGEAVFGEDNPKNLHVFKNKGKMKIFMDLSSQMTTNWKNLVGTPATKKISEKTKKRLLEEEGKPTADNSVIYYLVSKGANPNAQDCYGCSPLHYAAMSGNEVAASQLLILVEIKTDLKDNEKMTPLHLACAHNQSEIGRMLLEKNFYLFNSDESGNTPFHVACREGNEKLVTLMINLAEKRNQLEILLSETNRDGYTALHSAVENDHVNIAKICLDKNANPNAVTVTKRTALHMASHCGSVELVELLTSFGVILNVIDKFHQTPMHAAATKNHVGVIMYLIKKKADTESRDKDSYTPLLTAAAFGHVEAVKLLMNSNCDIFAVEKENKSALYIAVDQNHPKTVKTILSREGAADLLKIPDFKSNYPLHIACKEGREDIVKTLLDAGAVDDVKNEDERTPMHLAAKFGRTSIVKLLGERSKKSLINDEDEDANTPLHLAAKSGFPKIIQLLLDLGADVNSRNCDKWTALDCAAANGNLKASKVLLQNYAPVDSMDRSKVTPLYLACKNGHAKLVNLLLRNNAKISARIISSADDITNGYNPLDIAVHNNHRECALAILKSSDWKLALRNQTKCVDGHVDTPIRKMIRNMPDVAAEVFNKCTIINYKHPEHEDFEITYNFEFLEDSYASWEGRSLEDEGMKDIDSSFSSNFINIYDDNDKLLPTAKLYTTDTKQIKKNHPLNVMVESEREGLLDHPLVANLLKMKWNNFGQLVYYINLFIFICFLVALLAYMLYAVPPYKYKLRNKGMLPNETTCIHVLTRSPGERLHEISYICKYSVIVLGSIGVFKEIIQLIINKQHYFNVENIIEWMLYILAFVTVLDSSACQNDIGIREPWQWKTGTIAAFLGVINMVLFIRKVPFFGIFVVMFTDVMWTFIKFLPLLCLFNFAFAFAFFLLLNNQVAFRDLANSMLRTTVMMIGELDFDATFNSQLDESYLDNRKVFYDYVTYIIFVIFILMMNIITMNLLVGLAVDDIKAVQEKATLKRLAMKVTLALEVEGLVPECIRRRFIVKKLKLAPNKQWNMFKKLFGESVHPRNEWSVTEENMDQIEKIDRQQKESLKEVLKIKYKIKDLDTQSLTTKKMVTKLLKYLRVDFEEEDIMEDEL